MKYLGDGKFKIKGYEVDLQHGPTCTCNKYHCEHIAAAKQWMEETNLFNRAKAVVENNTQWSSNQIRKIYYHHQEEHLDFWVNVESHGDTLFLAMRGASRHTELVECGHLVADLSWKFTLKKWKYLMWTKKCRETFFGKAKIGSFVANLAGV